MNESTKKTYDSNNDIWGNPQVYKDVEFHPIRIKDTKAQSLFSRIFQFPKNFIREKEITKSSYLKYLLYYVQHSINPDGSEMQDMLVDFLKIITHNDNVYFSFELLENISGDFLDRLVLTLHIGDVKFTEEEFDIIREIILEQSGMSVEYIESYNPELEQMLLNSKNNLGNITFEDEIFIFCSMMKCKINEIADYTIYQFKKHLHHLLLVYNFQAYTPLQPYAKEGTDLVKHFFTHIEESTRYGSVLIPLDEFFASHNDPDMRDEKGNIVMKFDKDK